MPEQITCQTCGGTRKMIALHARMSDGSSRFGMELPCFDCDGTGETDAQMPQRKMRGALTRQRRLALGLGLRTFSERVGIPPSDVSRMQRGLVDPAPLEQKLAVLEKV